jgi:hypothetical protein
MNIAYAGLYGEPAEVVNDRDVLTQIMSFKNWELIKDKRKSRIKLDLSTIRPPKNCVLVKIEFIGVKKGEPRKIEVVGLDEYMSVSDLECEVDLTFEDIKIPVDMVNQKVYFPSIDFE